MKNIVAELTIDALANDLAFALERVDSLEHDVVIYREMHSVVLTHVVQLTALLERARRRVRELEWHQTHAPRAPITFRPSTTLDSSVTARIQ